MNRSPIKRGWLARLADRSERATVPGIGCLAMALALFVGTGSASAAPITADQASSIVRNWIAADGNPLEAGLSANTGEVTAYPGPDGSTAWYVVSLRPAGFVVVAADDRVGPVIAFSATGYFDPAPGNPLYAMLKADVPQRISAAGSDAGASAQSAGSLPAVKSGAVPASGPAQTSAVDPTLPQSSICRVRVAPLIQTKWGQGTDSQGRPLFNAYTPDNTAPGCVALCLAQTLNYYQWPTNGIGHNYSVCNVNEEPTFLWTRGGDGNGGPYQWSQMVNDPAGAPDLTETQRQAIAGLCYDAGVAIHSEYDKVHGTVQSLWDAPPALGGMFGFTQSGVIGQYDGFKGADYSTWSSNAVRMINPNLDARMPVFFSLMPADTNADNYAVICDGYGYSYGPQYATWMYHHLNFGEAGANDAWYNLPDVKSSPAYTNIARVVYNMMPHKTGEVISGRIVDQNEIMPMPDGQPNGMAMPGITVQITGPGGFITNTVTDAKGIYSFIVPSGANYTVTPMSPGQPFTPVSASVPVGTSTTYGDCGNAWAVDFRATSHVVAGRVTKGGQGLSGVNIEFDGLQTIQTDLDGWYILAVPNGWSGAVTPSRAIGGTFAPTNYFFDGSSDANTITNHFIWQAPTMVAISGNVLNAKSGLAVTNAVLTFPGCGVTARTDANGEYVAYVPTNWSGTVSLAIQYPDNGGIFLWYDSFDFPHSGGRTYNNVTGDGIGFQYYYWLPPLTETISGRVIRRDNGQNVTNATIQASGLPAIHTDGLGLYTLTVPYGWSGTVTPAHPRGGIFQPLGRSYDTVRSPQVGQNFFWTPPTPQLSGSIVSGDDGRPVSGVTVSLSDGTGSGVSGTDGVYRVDLPWRGWSGTLTPSTPDGGTFAPPGRPVTNVLFDAVLLPFTYVPPTVITGQVVRADTLGGVQGVSIAFVNAGATNFNAISDAAGFYGVRVPRGWSGTATPSHPAVGTFAPPFTVYPSLPGSLYTQNYLWTPPLLVLSGRVTRIDTGHPVAGVTLSFSNAQPVTATSPVVNESLPVLTDTNGWYGRLVPYGWSGSVTPTHPRGGTFLPPVRAYADYTSRATNENFTWLAPIPLFVGRVVRFDDGRGVEGAQLAFTNGPSMVAMGATNPLAIVTSDTNGIFSATLLRNWSGSVTPSFTQYVGGVFSTNPPIPRVFSNVMEDVSYATDTNAVFVFTPPPAYLAVAADPATRGTVTPSSRWYTIGAAVTVTAAPNSVSRFTRWQDGDTNPVRVVYLMPGTNRFIASFVDKGPMLAISGSLHFGDLVLGRSATRTVTVKNVGTAVCTIRGTAFPGGFRSQPAAFSINPGGTKTVSVTFQPYAEMTFTGAVTFVTYPVAGGKTSIAVSGRGIAFANVLSLTGDLDFGSVVVGQTVSHNLSLRNNGNTTLALRLASWSNGSGFTLTGLPYSLTPGATRILTLRFRPTQVRDYAGAMAVLTATGCSGSAILSPRGVGVAAGAIPHAVVTPMTSGAFAMPSGLPMLRVNLIDLSPASELPNDSVLLVLTMKNGRLVTASPGLDALGLAARLGTSVEAFGADSNANGVPDALESDLGAPLVDGMDLLVVRKQGDFAVPEAPFLGTVVGGAAVPVEAVPACWVLTPRTH